MSKELDSLRTAVASVSTNVDAAILLLQSPSEAPQVAQLAQELQAKSDALAAAVAAATPPA